MEAPRVGRWPRTRFVSAPSTSASGHARGTWEGSEGELNLVCECGDEDCTMPITLTPGEYEAVRAEETQFVVSPAMSAPRSRTSSAGG